MGLWRLRRAVACLAPCVVWVTPHESKMWLTHGLLLQSCQSGQSCAQLPVYSQCLTCGAGVK